MKSYEENASGDGSLFVVVALLIFTGVYYFVYSNVNWLLTAALLLTLVLCTKDRRLIVSGLSFLFLCAYTICGLYRIYVLGGGIRPLSMMTNVLVSLAISLILLYLQRKFLDNLYVKGIMLMQLVIPFVLLVYVMSRYKNGEAYVEISIPRRVQLLIILLISIFVIEAIIIIYKNWRNSNTELGNVISYGTCISIMAFNRFSGTGSIVSTDLRHPFENIIGYSQVIKLGQKAFSEYVPVSGMYSLIHGFFFDFFGKGKVSYYNMSTNLFCLMPIVLIVLLLKRQMKGEWVLFISIVLFIADNDRITFILPVMLLLTCPEIIKKKNLWLKLWYVTSFFHGLYYPVFGAAVCLGFFPLGLWQIMTYFKTGKAKADIRKGSFWASWILWSVPVVSGAGLLVGTLRHIRAMGKQTVYADGITRFGQTVPDNFLSYLQNQSIRLIVYYIFSYLILISIVWMSVALCLGIGHVRYSKRKLLVYNPEAFGISISFGIALLVAFSYTTIRLDINSIYARSGGMVYAAFVILILLVSRYMNYSRIKYYVFGFGVFLIAAVSATGFFSIETGSKLAAYYTVPDTYVYVENDQVDKFGTCFVEPTMYDSIENTYSSVQDLDRSRSYLGVVGNFGMFYMCGLKGDATVETGTIKGYEATQECVDLIQKNNTIVGGISSLSNYYLYHWLMTSGKYIWAAKDRRFYPNDMELSEKEVLECNKMSDIPNEGVNMGKVSGSWGLSMKSLHNIFADVDISYNMNSQREKTEIDFDGTINGNDADFLYLEFVGMDQNIRYILFNHMADVVQDVEEYPCTKVLMKKDYNTDITVEIAWYDDAKYRHSMNVLMDQGKLLIPLGSGRGWLLNGHSNIEITVNQAGLALTIPEIREVKFLKLREVK